MKYKKLILLLITSSLINGCIAYKIENISDPQFSDSKPNGEPISIRYLGVTEGFKKTFNNALLDKGFSNVTEGLITPQGYSADLQVKVTRKQNGTFLLYALTFGIFPVSSDVFEDMNFTFYNDGHVIRNASYRVHRSIYASFIIPTAFFAGGVMLNESNKQIASKLADNISLDFSVVDVDNF